MIRRTRKEIKKYFSKDISKQGLSFPEVAPPIGHLVMNLVKKLIKYFMKPLI